MYKNTSLTFSKVVTSLASGTKFTPVKTIVTCNINCLDFAVINSMLKVCGLCSMCVDASIKFRLFSPC